jgi:NTP pyrophosphatase (non-canonical NTP hydrolase)
MELNLKNFSELNRQRAEEGFKTYKNVPITYWTTALMGEGGELCNMVKKMERVSHGGIDGGSSYTASEITKDMLEEEIGGIGIYLDLLAGLLGISLEEAIIKTFNSKSEKYGFKQFLPTVPEL